jgi:hypothetical protein
VEDIWDILKMSGILRPSDKVVDGSFLSVHDVTLDIYFAKFFVPQRAA